MSAPGWLGGLIGIEPYVDGVPATPSRAWNLLGFTYTIDTSPESLAVGGWANLAIAGIAPATGDAEVSAPAGSVVISALTGITLDSPATTITGSLTLEGAALVYGGTSLRLDTDGALVIGNSDADSIEIGQPGVTTNIAGDFTVGGSPVGAAATDALTAKLAVRFRHTGTTIPVNVGSHGGVTSEVGDRALLDSLTTATDRGIYVVGPPGAWTRAADFDSTADIANGALVSVVEGTDAGKLYQLDQIGAVLATDALSFSQAGGGAPSESDVRAAAAGFTATLDVNDQTITDCTGVYGNAADDLVIGSAAQGVAVDGFLGVSVATGASTPVFSLGRAGLTSGVIDGGTTLTCTAATVNVATTAGDVLVAGNSTGAATLAGSTITETSAGTKQTNCVAWDVNASGAITVDGATIVLTSGTEVHANKFRAVGGGVIWQFVAGADYFDSAAGFLNVRGATGLVLASGAGAVEINGAVQIGLTSTRVYIANSSAVPGSNPAGGGYLYCEAGALKFRGSSGTVTTIAPA